MLKFCSEKIVERERALGPMKIWRIDPLNVRFLLESLLIEG
jgi:hypothetical protein